MKTGEATAFAPDIAIVGMAGRFPGARNIGEFWSNLRAGTESISRFTDEELVARGVTPAELGEPAYVRAGAVLPDMEMFDAAFFGLSPREAAIMNPQHRHFLECAWEALEQAGHVPERFSGTIGVFAGSGHSAYLPYNLLTNPALVESVGFFLLRHTGNDKDFLTTRLSYLLNLTGPSVNVQTACSTSLVAVHLACQSLLNGECDMALAGGVTIELPHRRGYLYREGEILSPDGHCRPFDAEAQGTVFGSGVGVVVLRRLQDALADGDTVHAIIRGSAVNNDGATKVGYLAPSVEGQAKAVAEALAVGHVDPDTVTYVEAHGTGTPVGDPIEIAALTQAFRRGTSRVGFCALGSVKSNIGHLDTAAGVASLIKVVLALTHRELPPSLHFVSPNPACRFDGSPFYVNARLAPWPSGAGPRRAGVSSLGVGGTNAHVVLEEAPPVPLSTPSDAWQVLPISAKTETALERATANLAEHLRRHPDDDLANTAYTLQAGRRPMRYRRVALCRSVAEGILALEGPAAPAPAGDDRTVTFLFAGGGAQYPRMGEELYGSEPVFRAAVDTCLDALSPHLDYDLRAVMFPEPGGEPWASRELEQPSRALPALFVIQYAQAQLWMSWGVHPTAMIGHSMGEYTAAHLAGVFTLQDALALVLYRGRLFEQVPGGSMLSVPLSADALGGFLGAALSIAAVNGPSLCVVSGPTEAIDDLQRALAARDVDSARIRIAVAAHSIMLTSILAPFGEFLRRLRVEPPRIPFVSNLTGQWITPEEATDPDYWVRHLRHTVRFADGLRELLRNPQGVLLEVGPGRTLATLARQHPDRRSNQPVLTSLPSPDEPGSDRRHALASLGQLWLAGVPVDWAGFHAHERRRRVALPTYPFERQRHWIEPGGPPGVPAARDPGDERVTRRAELDRWFSIPTWRQTPTPAAGLSPDRGSRVLILGDDTGLGDEVGQRLRGAGASVKLVGVGSGFARVDADRFLVDPRAPADLERVTKALTAEGWAPRDIMHFWTVGESDPARTRATAVSLAESHFTGLLHLVQAAAREGWTDALSLWVVSNDLVQIAGEVVPDPIKATVLGPVRVVPREFPGVVSRSIDVVLAPRGSWRHERLLDQLVGELSLRGLPDEVVAYRGTDRWVQTFEPVRLGAAPGLPTRLRPGGVYLITGGLGGIALVLAEHLVRAAGARLVLVGRSALPSRAEWDRYLERHGALGLTGRRIQQLRALERLGAEIMVAQADVTSPDALRTVVAEARRRFGAVHGVVHAAGVLDDGIIELKTDERAAAVLAPKVAGTLALEEALAGVPLDFLLLFSSISSIAGVAGQVDYAAANAFLDAYAGYRTARDGGFTVAVNWSAWRDVGMVAGPRDAAEINGDSTSGAGPTALGDGIHNAPGERVNVTRLGPRSHWILGEHRVREGPAILPGTAHLELARAAFASHPANGAVEMRDVSFLSPLAALADEERDLRVTIRPDSSGNRFTIESRPHGVDGGPGWQEHARGSIHAVDSGVRFSAIPPIAARCRLRERIPPIAETHAHLAYGRRWSCVTRIGYGRGEALISLRLEDAFLPDLDEFVLHPAILDMATAGAQALIPGCDEGRDFFVPLSYGMVRVEDRLPQTTYSHVRLRDDSGGDPDFASFDVTVYDEQGRVLVDIAEFVMIRVRDKTLLTGHEARGASRDSVLGRGAVAPSRRDSPVGATAPRPAGAIDSTEGMAALDRILSGPARPQIVVSPVDLPGLLAQLRTGGVPPRPDAPEPELGPVEEALLSHPAVAAAAVVQHGQAGADRRLAAYVVYHPSQSVTVSEIRRHLRRSLPESLVPQAFIGVDAIPRSLEGGVDRAALPNPFQSGPTVAPAPLTPMQATLAELWQELLGVDRVSPGDNFFDIGGHSLLSMRLINRVVKKVGVRLQHADVAVNTLEQLAAMCEEIARGPGRAVGPSEPRGRGLLATVRQTVFRTR